jgi:hypothetical protein
MGSTQSRRLCGDKEEQCSGTKKSPDAKATGDSEQSKICSDAAVMRRRRMTGLK